MQHTLPLSVTNRDVFYKVSDADDDAVDCRVEFSNLEESLWWVKFTDNDTRAIKHTHLTSGVDVETLCQVLGTSQIGHETLRIHSGTGLGIDLRLNQPLRLVFFNAFRKDRIKDRIHNPCIDGL